MGPKFWLFDVSDYNRTDEDVLHGLGGRWISVRYVLHDGVTVNRSDKVAEIVNAFTEDGWTLEELPSEKYVLSEIYETADSDLCFRRPAREGESEHWTFRTIIHVSEGGNVICQYCEVGW